MTGLADYLGRNVGEFLNAEPFSGWRVTRSVEHVQPATEIWYEFKGRGVEVICDEFDRVRSVFLHRGDGESLAGIPFSLSRREVLERFGVPEKSGGPTKVPGLGDNGPWDRFTIPGGALHIKYCFDHDAIEQITLMRADAVP